MLLFLLQLTVRPIVVVPVTVRLIVVVPVTVRLIVVSVTVNDGSVSQPVDHREDGGKVQDIAQR